MEQAPLSPYKHATTDADGLARFAIPGQEGHRRAPYGHHLLRIDGAGRLGVASTWWYFGSSPWGLEVRTDAYFAGQRGHLFTERPIYRPGETVSYKGVVRDEDDASYAIPGADATFTVTIRDPRYQNLPTTRVTLNEIGTFSGDFMLPADAPTGTYRVSVTDEDGNHVASTHFTVAEFRVPEFKVEVEAPKTDYLAGETIAAEARASFYFDAPVAGADAEWAARAWPTVIRVDGYEDYSFRHGGIPYWARRGWDSLRSSGEARTTDAGVARFDVPAQLEPDEGTHGFIISATVTDASGQAIAGSTRVTVHPATWYAGIKPESYVATAGEPTTVHLVTVDFERRIAPNRPVTVRAFKREWVPTEERVYYIGAYYRSEPRDTEVDVQSVTTNAAGEASVEFTPPSAGNLPAGRGIDRRPGPRGALGPLPLGDRYGVCLVARAGRRRHRVDRGPRELRGGRRGASARAGPLRGRHRPGDDRAGPRAERGGAPLRDEQRSVAHPHRGRPHPQHLRGRRALPPADRGRPLPALPRRLRQSLRLHGAAPPRRQHPARPGGGPARRDRRLRGAGHGLGGSRGGGRRLRRRRRPGGALTGERGGAGRHGRVLVRARPGRADLLIARGLDRPAQRRLP